MLTPQNAIYFLIFLGVLVTVHEFGHFVAAKWAGVKVLVFSIGFGPKIVSFRRGETTYQLAWVPLGGYVRMAGEYGDEVSEEEQARSYLKAPWWKRAIISVAGPAFNLIFPIIAIFFALVGEKERTAARVGWAEPGGPAAVAGIVPGDLITHIDGRAIKSFDQIRETMLDTFGRGVPVTVRRGEKEMVLSVSPTLAVDKNPVQTTKRGVLGIMGQARAAVVGVPAGSIAEAAGLKTFDRVLRVNDQVVRDELELVRIMGALQGPLTVQVARSVPQNLGALSVVLPSLHTVKIERQPGEGFAALGAESGDLYVWSVLPKTPAAQAGLHVGDRLVSVDGKPLQAWVSLTQRITEGEGKAMALVWRRDGVEASAEVSPATVELMDELKNKLPDVYELGLRPRMAFQFANDPLAEGPQLEKIKVVFSPAEAFIGAVKQVPEAVRLIGTVLGRLMTRQISADNVGGPIMLFQVAAKSAEAGYEVFLGNMALVSVNLGLVNLLPIPILDGFAILAALWEGVRRRPIPLKAREVANYVGFAMLATLMVLVFYNDISKMFR
jgi:regulator of sigma E protease